MNFNIEILAILYILYRIFEPKIKIFLGWLASRLTTFFPSLKRVFLLGAVLIAEGIYILNYFGTIISETLIKSFFGAVFSLVSLVIAYIFIWRISGLIHDISQVFLSSLYNFLGYPLSDDLISLSALNLGNKLLPFELTATITLFYFIYREQRSASISIVLTKSSSIYIYIILTGITITLGTQLGNLLDREITQFKAIYPDAELNLTYSSLYLGRLLVWVIFAGISFLYGLRTIIQLIRSLNIRNMVKDVLDHMDNQLFILRLVRLESQRNSIYKNLFSCLESINQLFITMIEKNMDEAFIRAHTKWLKIVADLLQSPRLSRIDNTVISEYLLKKDMNSFERFFELILKYHVTIIMVLIKNHKIEYAQRCIRVFFEMSHSEIKLRFVYLNVLQELALLFYSNDTLGMKSIFEGLEKLSFEDSGQDQNGINLIYKSLINKAIEKNDVKTLSSISYSMYKCLERFDNAATPNFSNLKLLQIRGPLKLGPQNNNQNQFMHCTIFILLQAALKSIELSHYACTGFLMKFIVTSFKSSLTVQTFYVFTKNKGENNPYLEQREKFEKINVSFNFNTKTIDYCHKKLSILLFGQQKYVLEKQIDFGEKPKSFIDVSHVKCNYLLLLRYP